MCRQRTPFLTAQIFSQDKLKYVSVNWRFRASNIWTIDLLHINQKIILTFIAFKIQYIMALTESI